MNRIKSVIRSLERRTFSYIRKNGPSMYRWPRWAVVEFARVRFRDRLGYRLNLENPTSFAEKLQWYKFHYNNSEIKNIVDKCDFKKYIAERLGEGYTIELYNVWDNIEDIEKSWSDLPKCFVLKSTISGNGEHLKIVRDKSEINFLDLKEELITWFDPKNTNLNTTLTGYYACRPRILAEKYEENVSGQLYDYKFFCFSGEPHYIYVATEHFPGQLSHISFYDLNWNMLEVHYGEHPNCNVEKPRHFNEMLEIAKQLSSDFPFVRVDFFDTKDRLFLAEMTFYPGSGYIRYTPNSFNKTMGDLFVLPE